MPLPSDERLVSLAQELLAQFHAIFGPHPGFRPAHAKGALIKGTFTPSAEAALLTSAPHILRESVPVLARFSDSTGIPQIPDTDPNARPWGMALRFYLAERVHTDIVSHSVDGFPTHTGDEFLEFLRAIAATKPESPHPNPVEAFVGSHPAALAFVQALKPFPASFANETFFAVTAYRFTNKDGVSRYGRYRILPVAGSKYIDDAEVAGKAPDVLFDELTEHLKSGPIQFRIVVQVAEPGDTVDNATIHWPEDRDLVELGVVSLTERVPDDAAEQKHLIFDPIPRIDGIEPSDDPLLELRAALYLLSGRERRSA
ncbi:catalase family peroxidase [Paracidobacterium acidisoli]|uniref:Catalase-related peroxidase n=1 Tax=Paracidobacterium acidisoli TaxID=2303751 RepID=A0A372INI3_9BACT|nr:catalase family peroxidase [Paracidobacterium acidisoli]MBT9331971.1 catalase family peroxidase [Paracidobacterium acidisoli]